MPDSAGTATAFLCGVKANYETLGVTASIKTTESSCDAIKQNSVPSILKWAIDSGKRAGVVTTTRITHATPGASYSHVAHRDHENDGEVPGSLKGAGCMGDIARQLIEESPGKDLHVILGGGRKHLLPSDVKDPKINVPGLRRDGRNLINEWSNRRKSELKDQSKYRYVNSTRQLLNVDTYKVDYLMGLFNYEHVSYDAERDVSETGKKDCDD